MGKNFKQWDMIISQIEFAYNRSMYQSVGMSLFEVVYGTNPIGHLDLVPYPSKKQFSGDVDKKVKEINKLHEHVKASIEKKKMKGIYGLLINIESMWSSMWVTWFGFI